MTEEEADCHLQFSIFVGTNLKMCKKGTNGIEELFRPCSKKEGSCHLQKPML